MRADIKKYGAFLIWTLVMVIPIIIFAGKSVPAADDFSNAAEVLESSGPIFQQHFDCNCAKHLFV